jgi:hypothetical protein
MTPPPPPRLEPTDVQLDGPGLRITNLNSDPDVILEFKSEASASAACNAIKNYLEIADVEPNDESVMHMLEVVLGRHDVPE